LAIFGGVEIVEPNRVLRWCELGTCLTLTVLGIIDAVIRHRKEREK
jgi:hypothetical protein